MADQTALLARRLRALERRELGRKTPQLANSTIIGGAVQATDVTGETLTMQIGQQFDGTNASAVVTGPTPPAPSALLVTPGIGSLRIYWDGTFAAGAFAPMDFARVVFYAIPTPDYTGPNPIDQSIIVGEINTATGGEVTAALEPGTEYLVWAHCWSQAGKFSAASDPTYATPSIPVPLVAPTISPTPLVYGTAEALVVRAVQDDLVPGTTLKYHISTTDSFTPDSTTLAVITQSTVAVITATPPTAGAPDGKPLDPNTTYFIKIVATNDAGTAPASAQGTGRLDDDRISQVVAAQVVAGFVLAGSIDVGSNIHITPDGGIVIQGPPGVGDTVFPSNGSNPRIAGELVASSLQVMNNLSINGSGTMNGELALKAGISAPTATPTLGYEWPSIKTNLGDGTGDNGWIYTDMAPDIGTAAGSEGVNRSVVSIAFYGGGLRFIDNRNGNLAAFPDPTLDKSWRVDYDIFGVASDSVRGLYWVLGRDRGRTGSPWYIYSIDANTFDKRSEFAFWTDAAIGGYFPKLAYYNGVLWLAFSHNDGTGLHFRKHTVGGTNAAPTLTVNTATDVVVAWSGRVAFGFFDVGTFDSPTSTPHIVWRQADSDIFRVVKADGTAATELGPWLSPAAKIRGGRWTSGGTLGNRFIAFDNTGMFWFFSENRLNTNVQGSYSYYDPDTGGTGGTHETQDGPPSSTFVWQCRTWLNATTKQAPDEQNTDATNLDKANATRLYAGLSGGTRYLQETLGKLSRTVQLRIDDDNPTYGDTFINTGSGMFAFTQDDVGATITGPNIPAGTTILEVVAKSGGQQIRMSAPNTLAVPSFPTVITATVTRSVFAHKTRAVSTLTTGSKTPEGSNGFITANITPGVLKSVAQDANGSIIQLSGDGSGRIGVLSWDKTGKVTYKDQQRGTSTISGTATTSRTVVVALDPAIFNGAAPSNVQVTPTGSWSDVAHCYVASKGANQFTLGARNTDAAAFSASTPVTVDWVAWV